MITKSLPRVLLGVGLLGASSLSLSAGGAKATQVCTFANVPDPVVPCVQNPVPTTVGDKSLTVITSPTVGSGDVELTNPTNTPTMSVHAVDMDFTGELADTTPGSFKYKLSIDTNSPWFYEKAVLRWVDGTNAPTSSVTKNIYTDSGFMALFGTTSTNGGTINLLPLTPGTKDIWVEDLYTSGGALDSIRNDFVQVQGVPGPLPLLGAGTAFGFSRRLRRRSKARVSLG